MTPVEVSRIADIEMTHEFTEVSQGSFEQKVEVIDHQNITIELHIVYVHRTDELFEEDVSVVIVTKDRLLLIAPAGYMVNGIRILDP